MHKVPEGIRRLGILLGIVAAVGWVIFIATVSDGFESTRHLIIAAARPNTGRPYTPTFNIRIGPPSSGPIEHGFRPQPIDDASLKRGGSIEEYLHHERAALLAELNAFPHDPRAGLKKGK
jgi:hypothetical protein